MNISPSEITVGELVRAVPARARVFEELRIDYCCGGKKPLTEACYERELDPAAVLAMLDDIETIDEVATVDIDALSIAALCDHIVSIHHEYLRQELPRLDFMTRKVAAVHGEHEPRLAQIRQVFEEFAAELIHHTHHEEEIVFPQLRAIESPTGAAVRPDELRCILSQMEDEHDEAGNALKQFRDLADDFMPPEWACNTFRALYDSLAQLERDMHEHVHKENNVLFPRALAALSQ